MNKEIQDMCDLIISNRNALKKKMTWEMDSNTYAVMAGILTATEGVNADPDKYKECKDILHKNVGVFSEIRGIVEAVVVTKMMLSDDADSYAKGVLEIYQKLRKIHKLTASPFMVMAAMNIYEHVGTEGADADIEKLEDLYKTLQKDHPLLISDEDRGFLSMLIACDVDTNAVSERIEACYQACKKISIDKDLVHTLAQVMALSDVSPERGNEFVKNMLDGLKENKTKIDKTYGMSILGACTMLGMSEDQLVADISDASNYLKGKDGFKFFDEGKGLRTTYAAIAVFSVYAKDNSKLASQVSSNIAMNIAEMIILLICIMITNMMIASSNASSNSSN